MILRMPKYCQKFTCTADKCGDNCCIGWEIDIDDSTAAYYNSIDGSFGKQLRENISNEGTKHFILNEQERCPFLNNRNLCNIILKLGEDKLCDICTEHPRYYEWLGDVKEGGIGLCCEEAARLIISAESPSEYFEKELPAEETYNIDGNLYDFLFDTRKNIFSHLENESLPFGQRICNVLKYAENLQYQIDNDDWDICEIVCCNDSGRHDFKAILEYLAELEPIDGKWIPYLNKITGSYEKISTVKNFFIAENPDVIRYLRNIAAYFIWRYFLKGTFDGELLSKVKLMAVSVAVLGYMYCCKWLECKKLTHEDCAQLAKSYSKEIEYSDLNLDALTDASYEIQAFGERQLRGLFI